MPGQQLFAVLLWFWFLLVARRFWARQKRVRWYPRTPTETAALLFCLYIPWHAYALWSIL